MVPPVNPHAKPRAAVPVVAHNNEVNMGRQSQQRASNQHKRKCKLCSNNNSRKRRPGDQLTLEGSVAFDPDRDCKQRKAKSLKKIFPSCTAPHRVHHPLCIHNKTTRGQGELTAQSLASLEDDKRHKALAAPVQLSERRSGKRAAKAVGETFFKPRAKAKSKPMTMRMDDTDEAQLSPLHFSKAVEKMVNDEDFRKQHQQPLHMRRNNSREDRTLNQLQNTVTHGQTRRSTGTTSFLEWRVA